MFGEVREAVVCFQTMAKTMIRDNVEADSIKVETYVKELAVVTMDQEGDLRFINMFAAA